MPICENCKQEWTWLQTIKNMFRLTCPYCKTKQYQSARSKKKASYINALPIIGVFLANVLFSVTIGVSIVFLVLLLTVFIATIPFYMELANEEEFWF